MIEQRFEFIGDGLYVYTYVPQYGGGVCESNLVMTKEIFQECYKKWIKPQEREKVEKEVNTVLDKIVDEIQEYKSRKSFGVGLADLEKGKETALDYVIAIINKYREEGSDNE